MIRKATKHDKVQIIEMLELFKVESKIEQFQGMDINPSMNRLLDHILAGRGVIFIEDGKGFIMAVITSLVWCDEILKMYELAWYVKPEFRGSTVGYRLLKSYVEYGKQLKKEGRIKLFSMGKMVTSPNIKYEKFGFSKLEENWIQ